MKTGRPNIIILSPIGKGLEFHLDHVGSEVTRLFGYPTEILPLLDDIHFAYNPQRDQYHSTAILSRLCEQAPPGALKVIGVTDQDLYIPILTHVYGEAQLGGKACVVSTSRLNEGFLPGAAPDTLQCRLTKEAIHELGHTFNLRHCRETLCIMHYCRKIEHVDRKSQSFCRYCGVMLKDELIRLRKEGNAG